MHSYSHKGSYKRNADNRLYITNYAFRLNKPQKKQTTLAKM